MERTHLEWEYHYIILVVAAPGAKVSESALTNDLPTTLAAFRQDRVDGELVLEQNDGTRRLYWRKGELVYLLSDAAGEQFGSYLLRQGVIDFATLNKLLGQDDRYRIGEKVVQWGLMTVEQRDSHLRRLQEQLMLNALEHPVVRMVWNPGSLNLKLSEDLYLKLDHRHLIWNAFLEAHNLQATYDLLHAQGDWKWEGMPRLLESLSDLPLTPANAYAISFLGSEPISFDTFEALSGLDEEEAGRIFLSLWAVGSLILTMGQLPGPAAALKPPPPPPRRLPAPPPSANTPRSVPAPPPSRTPAPAAQAPAKPVPEPPTGQGGPYLEIEPDFSYSYQPEFLDLEDEPARGGAGSSPAGPPARQDMSPAGPPVRQDLSPAGLPVRLDLSPAGLPVRQDAPSPAPPARQDVSPAGPRPDRSPAGPPPPGWNDLSPAGPPPVRAEPVPPISLPLIPEPSSTEPLPLKLDFSPAGPPPMIPDTPSGSLPPLPPVPQLDQPGKPQTPTERARSLYHKARQLHYKSLTGEAIHSLELSVQLDPTSDEAYPVWLLLGQLRMSNPAWATRSVNAFQAAARIRPNNAEPWICMGQVYHRKGFRTNALACFQKALELDPSVPMPHGIDLAELEDDQTGPLPAPTLFEKFKSILKGQDRG
jgi:hypothetical protein